MIPVPPGDPILATTLARLLGKRGPSLAKASRVGRGPAGRFLLSGTVAAYPRAAVLEWIAAQEAAGPARLEAARARAKHAREVRAAKRAEARS